MVYRMTPINWLTNLIHDEMHVPERVQRAVQAVCNCSPMSAAQSTTVHERLLHPHLGHCSSAAPAVRWLPSATCAATPPFDVRSTGLVCGRPRGLELVTRLSSKSDAFCWQFSSSPENFYFLVLLAILRYINLLLTLTMTILMTLRVVKVILAIWNVLTRIHRSI